MPAVSDQPLRILHAVRAPVGGIFRHILDLANGQADRGHHVGLIADSLTGGERAEAALAAIAPDFAELLFEFPFGDIYARPGLGLRDREIATIAALCAMGTARPQLEVHINAGLNVGLTRQEITEVLIQMAVYVGFPAALNGLAAARSVFAARD